MPGDYQSSNDRAPSGVTLDRLPDGPPDRARGGDRSGGSKLGEFGSSPGLMALQGLEQIEKGLQLVSAGAPNLPPQLLQMSAMLLTQLRQAVPQSISGGGGPMPPSGILTPPSMGAPPGMGAQGGAPNAPSPIPPGLG